MTKTPWTFPGWCRCGHPEVTHTFGQRPAACQARNCREKSPGSADYAELGDCACPGFRPPTWRQRLRNRWDANLRGLERITRL